MSDQPPRFAARSAVFRDHILPAGPKALYALMDDIGWNGICSVHQPVLADFMGVNTRSVRDWAAALERSGYVVVERQKDRVRYVLGWYADRKPGSDHIQNQIGSTLPIKRKPGSEASLEADKQNTPLTPRKRGERKYVCNLCRDRGVRAGRECYACLDRRRAVEREEYRRTNPPMSDEEVARLTAECDAAGSMEEVERILSRFRTAAA